MPKAAWSHVTGTVANVADVTEVPNLLHDKERHVFGHAVYIGTEKRAPKRGRKFWIAAKHSVVKAIDGAKLREITEQLEHAKASIRAAMEHPFRVLKRRFGYVRGRCKGLARNTAQVTTLFALGNLWIARRHLPTSMGWVRPADATQLPRAAATGRKPYGNPCTTVQTVAVSLWALRKIHRHHRWRLIRRSLSLVAGVCGRPGGVEMLVRT